MLFYACSEALEAELETDEESLEWIEEKMQDFINIYPQTLESAKEEVNEMVWRVFQKYCIVYMYTYKYIVVNCISNFIFCQCEEFHSNVTERLSNEVSIYQPEKRFDPTRYKQYCERMKEHLQEKFREEEAHLKEQWSAVAAHTVQYLCGMNTTLLQ